MSVTISEIGAFCALWLRDFYRLLTEHGKRPKTLTSLPLSELAALSEAARVEQAKKEVRIP